MEQKKPEQGARDSSVRKLYIAPRAREVPPLTDAEILALRQLLIDAETIKDVCPVAKRALSPR
jgi:hypothetical protein